jgi:maleamate amidohydrolase
LLDRDVEDWQAQLDQLRHSYERSEMVGRVGWGLRPALVVVDLQQGFTDPGCPLGGDHDEVVGSARRLLAATRLAKLPAVFTIVRYRSGLEDAGIWPAKLPSQRHLVEGSPWTLLDERLERTDEPIVVKQQASAFCRTDLAENLGRLGVDTVVVCGLTTSGCVRATAVDACGLGFRTIVVRDAVGDRHRLVHEVSLFDIDAKYGDVVTEDEAVTAIGGYQEAS